LLDGGEARYLESAGVHSPPNCIADARHRSQSVAATRLFRHTSPRRKGTRRRCTARTDYPGHDDKPHHSTPARRGGCRRRLPIGNGAEDKD